MPKQSYMRDCFASLAMTLIRTAMDNAKKKILVVDDEADIVTILQMRLEAGGYEVISASDGNNGYAKAKSENPDLIILDVMLPGMDGYKVCRLLKFDQKYKHIPIIMLTAKGGKDDQDLSRQVGANLFLNKPPELKELLAKVNELLNLP